MADVDALPMHINSDWRRVSTLRGLDVLDTEPDDGLNGLVRAAARVCETPIAIVSLVDLQRQWFKASVGLNGLRETSRTYSFCAHTILGDDLLEIPNTLCDRRFTGNVLVTGAADIRFYAGVPLILEDGTKLGALCVIDRRPRRLTEVQRRTLRDLAAAAVSLLQQRQTSQQLERAAMEIEFLATHDSLTKLLNRDALEQRLRALLKTAQSSSFPHTLLHVDLDRFCLVSGQSGATADALLRKVAWVLSESSGREDVARLGGDKFALIMNDCTAAEAECFAGTLNERLRALSFTHGGETFHVSASIGAVPIDARWSSAADILQAAEAACGIAKEAGRNRAHVLSDADHLSHARQIEMLWAARIETALAENRFVLFAQQIQPLDSHSAGMHAEVLLRMRSPEGEVIPPSAFLPAAQRFNLSGRVDRWVLVHATKWIESLERPQDLNTLFVNLSGQSVGDPEFHAWALARLSAAGPEICGRLCLEITETATISNIAEAAAFVDRVRALGVRIALDDFGTGASSFSYLKALKVDFLKIDGQFIHDLVDNKLDQAAVRCFREVANVAGLKTVAEFVHNEAVLRQVYAMKIDYAQGFFIHRPAPLHELLHQPELALEP